MLCRNYVQIAMKVDKTASVSALSVLKLYLRMRQRIISYSKQLGDYNAQSVILNATEINTHDWLSLSNWIKSGKENNIAIPHLERLPCVHDDVVFPNGYLSGTVFISQDVTIKSLKFGDEYWGEQELDERNQDETLSNTIIFSRGAQLKITNDPCDDDSGCLCGNEIYYKGACLIGNVEAEIMDCTDPILPVGFCHKICGATIVFKPENNFQITSAESKLKGYASDTHVSKVKNKSGEIFIQIIFTEKQFTGKSIEEAKNLYQILQDDKTIQLEKSTFLKSSYPNKSNKTALNTVSIIFGSLLCACVIFALVLFMFGDNERGKQFRERFGLGARPLSYKSVFFSRSSSVSEGTGLIVEGQSIMGSMPSIPKTFENPTFSEFQKKSYSTSTSNASSIEDLPKEANPLSKTSDSTEPQVFEEQRRNLIETVAEEGELVDLSDMS